jgi:hypothetical protein
VYEKIAGVRRDGKYWFWPGPEGKTVEFKEGDDANWGAKYCCYSVRIDEPKRVKRRS